MLARMDSLHCFACWLTIRSAAIAHQGSLFRYRARSTASRVLWTVSSGLLVFYIENVGAVARTYGALTGVVALLAWVYLTSLAFVAGAVVDAELESRRA